MVGYINGMANMLLVIMISRARGGSRIFGRGVNSRQQSLGWRCIPSMLCILVLGVWGMPPSTQEIDGNLGTFPHITLL